MAADIVPELLGAIQANFNEGINNSSVIKAVNAAIEAGTATHKDALKYAQEVGKILEGAYKKHITVAALPDGKMYYNIANRIINPTLRADHARVADITVSIQDALNSQAGIGIKGIRPMANADRIKGFVERLSTEQFDDVSWLLGKPIENFSMAVVDDVVRANADFHSRAGLKPTITRTVVGETCDWCSNLAGTYDYEDVKATGHPVFVRHRYCDCLVEYNPGDGTSKTNVHTKKVAGSREDKAAQIELMEKREARYKKEEEKKAKSEDSKSKAGIKDEQKNWQSRTNAKACPAIQKSLYKDAVETYQKTGRKAQKWQSTILDYIMAVNSDKLWAHAQFGYSVPRQNGKNEIVAMRELYGLINGEMMLHTAHRTSTSHMAWERLCGLLDEAEIKYDSIKAKGSENIRVGDGRIEFRTRTTLGGLGESYDLLVIDEAQEYTTEQATALKYVIAAADNPQTIFCGTPPTPLSSGTVFMNLRNDALSGQAIETGWAEWSVEEESDVNDIDLWYLTNPALGVRLTERKIRMEISSDTIDFNIQRLGLWLKYNQKSAISKNEWEVLQQEKPPELTGNLFVGIKYGNNGLNVAVSVAVKTKDDRIFIDVRDCQSIRNGNGWIISFLQSIDYQTVVIDGASGQSLLASEMKDSRLKPPILPTVKEVILANSSFEQAIFRKSICHMGQPSLTEVVANCEKRPIGSSGGFGYRSQVEDYDIALLDSVMLAHWACATAKPVIKQRINY